MKILGSSFSTRSIPSSSRFRSDRAAVLHAELADVVVAFAVAVVGKDLTGDEDLGQLLLYALDPIEQPLQIGPSSRSACRPRGCCSCLRRGSCWQRSHR